MMADDEGRGRARFGRGALMRLASELVIVFVGVYGAFWVERFRQEVEDRERATTILEALAREIGGINTEGPYVRDAMAAALAEFDSATARGLHPPPAYYREPAAETPSISVWQATVASGGVNLLDPNLFFTLAAFYNRVESFSRRYLRYNEVTERDLLPRLSQGAEAFYDPHSGELDPTMEVHLDQLRTLLLEADQILERADSLEALVRAEAERFR